MGSIPAHWEVGNLRRFAQMKTGHTPSRNETSYWDNCNIPWFGLADVWQLRDGTRKYLGETKENISEIGLANSAAELLPAGTVILSRTASVGFTGIMPVQMATTQDFWNWICGPKLLPDYLYWLFRAMGPKIEQTTNGSTHKTIYQGDAASFEICVPPLETQRRIAWFLDEKTARIDGLIEKKRALLDRLAEKRQALITRAVTKGLNPAAPMKPSGIDWLGDIPAHWEVKPLRRVRRYMTSGSRDWAAYYADEGDPFLRMTNVTGHGVELDLDDLRFVNVEGIREGTRTSVREGDILITITAELGSVAIVRKGIEGAYINQHLALFRPNAELCTSDFLVNFLSTDMARAQFTVSGQGGTKQGLGFEQVNNVILGFPPRAEQESIGGFCAELWRQFQSAERPLSSTIERLSEYRAALITAAVTGKLEIA
ncbi:restriction endonuclease subunit S [Mesorhizobium sp.]|uniref:restriction endonuclease subunit S n=1 Tax=Mesorhizobium sp. TaxID=1871066 RepID=UPI00257E8D9F|nr:restriction endonuclease subunit S [Mesorhizobium sp.]